MTPAPLEDESKRDDLIPTLFRASRPVHSLPKMASRTGDQTGMHCQQNQVGRHHHYTRDQRRNNEVKSPRYLPVVCMPYSSTGAPSSAMADPVPPWSPARGWGCLKHRTGISLSKAARIGQLQSGSGAKV